MRFLDTNQIGFDGHSLGFPSVGSCQAFVYQTPMGLFGLHASASNMTHLVKCQAWAQYIQGTGMNLAGGAQGLYLFGVITQSHRFAANDDASWHLEVLAAANALGFNGTVLGARLTSNVAPTESAYIRFDWHMNNRATIKYKRWSKMEMANLGAPVNHPDRRNLIPVPNGGGAWQDTNPGTQEQDVRRNGQVGEGSLHRVWICDTIR